MGARRPLIAGNWKMFGRKADLSEIAKLADGLPGPMGLDVAICPPATLLASAAERFGAGPVGIGAQDVFPGGDGAQTGDINAAMLADAGARYVIVGHSERRRDHGETDAQVRAKAEAAIGVGMITIVCVGETIDQRKAGRAGEVVRSQVLASAPSASPDQLVVAYEPVWAIGTGLTPTIAEIAEIHGLIRQTLPPATAPGIRLLYGGSVKPANAAEIFTASDVDGALVGGASLKAADFLAIIRAHPVAAR